MNNILMAAFAQPLHLDLPETDAPDLSFAPAGAGHARPGAENVAVGVSPNASSLARQFLTADAAESPIFGMIHDSDLRRRNAPGQRWPANPAYN